MGSGFGRSCIYPLCVVCLRSYLYCLDWFLVFGAYSRLELRMYFPDVFFTYARDQVRTPLSLIVTILIAESKKA